MSHPGMDDSASSQATAQEPGMSEGAPGVDAALARHLAELQAQFPLPDLDRMRAAAMLRARQRKRRTATAACTLLAALLGGTYWLDPAYRVETMTTLAGEQRTWPLTDGSTVVLDTGTEIQVAWHVRSRRAVLAQGQAYFDVARSSWRPFSVDAGLAEVTVTGTSFDVDRGREQVDVRLYEGSVAVQRTDAGSSSGPSAWQLRPGQALRVGAEAVLPYAVVAGEARPAWADGLLVFEQLPLADALAQIQRYRPERIMLDDPSLAGLRVSGVFQIAQAARIFDLLPRVWPVQVDQQADEIHVRASGAPKRNDM